MKRSMACWRSIKIQTVPEIPVATEDKKWKLLSLSLVSFGDKLTCSPSLEIQPFNLFIIRYVKTCVCVIERERERGVGVFPPIPQWVLSWDGILQKLLIPTLGDKIAQQTIFFLCLSYRGLDMTSPHALWAHQSPEFHKNAVWSGIINREKCKDPPPRLYGQISLFISPPDWKIRTFELKVSAGFSLGWLGLPQFQWRKEFIVCD